MFGGRIEAFFTVPSSITASVDAGSGAQTVTWAAGSYTPTSFATYTASALTAQAPPAAGSWSVSLSTGTTGTGLLTIARSTGSYSITWTSTALRDLMGFTADITSQTSVTATNQHAGLWFPDCPLVLDGHPSRAHKQTDNRGSESPSGLVITLGGTKKYQHKNLSYSHVPIARVWEDEATTAGASLEQWLDDTQFGDGHTWFSRGSAFQAYWSNNGTDTLVGLDLNGGTGPSSGWYFSPCIEDIHNHVSRSSEQWLGMLSVRFPRIVTPG